MLPMIVAAGEHQAWLRPYDLGPDQETACVKTLGHGPPVDPGVPDIGDLARKQAPGIAPVGAIVVIDLAGPRGRGNTGLDSPVGIVLDAIRWVRHHQVRTGAVQHALDIGRDCRVAA